MSTLPELPCDLLEELAEQAARAAEQLQADDDGRQQLLLELAEKQAQALAELHPPEPHY